MGYTFLPVADFFEEAFRDLIMAEDVYIESCRLHPKLTIFGKAEKEEKIVHTACINYSFRILKRICLSGFELYEG